jgi:hypothetical protein
VSSHQKRRSRQPPFPIVLFLPTQCLWMTFPSRRDVSYAGSPYVQSRRAPLRVNASASTAWPQMPATDDARVSRAVAGRILSSDLVLVTRRQRRPFFGRCFCLKAIVLPEPSSRSSQPLARVSWPLLDVWGGPDRPYPGAAGAAGGVDARRWRILSSNPAMSAVSTPPPSATIQTFEPSLPGVAALGDS